MTEGMGSIEPLLDRPVSASPSAMVRTLPDGSSVVLDLETERYVGLDAVAADMWEALNSHATVGEARRHLLDTYDVEPERLDVDLLALVDSLASRGLLVLGEMEDTGGG